MIKYNWAWLFFCVVFTFQVSAQTIAAALQQPAFQKQQAGIASVREMALLLHTALQRSDFDLLQPYIPTKQVYDKLMQLGDAPVRESLLLYLPDQIQNDFQKDFSQLLKDGALLEINWSEAKIKDITADTVQVKNAAIIPVKLELTSYGLPPVPVTFNVIRLDGKYYYLGPLQIPNKDLNSPQRKY